MLTFYKQALDGRNVIPAEHVGLLYASLEATAGAGETVRLTAEGEASLEVEMSLLRQDDKEEIYEFSTVAGSELRFGRRVGGITVDAEDVAATTAKNTVGHQRLFPLPFKNINARFLCHFTLA